MTLPYIDRLELNQPGGVPRLDVDGLIPDALIPSTITRDTELGEVLDPASLGVFYTIDPRLVPATSVSVGTSNKCHFFRVLWAATITKIAVNTVTSSGNICLAVYSNTGSGRSSLPDSRKGTSGSVACPAADSVTEVSLTGSVDVIVGDWLALVADNATATFGGTGGGLGVMSKGLVAYQDSAFPCPATATPTTGAANRVFSLLGVV